MRRFLVCGLVTGALLGGGCACTQYSFTGTFAQDVPSLDNLPRLHRKMWELSGKLQALGLAQVRMNDEIDHFDGQFTGTYKGVPQVTLNLTCLQCWADPGPEFEVVVSAAPNRDSSTAAKCQEILEIIQEQMTIEWEPTIESNTTSEPAPGAGSEAVHPFADR